MALLLDDRQRRDWLRLIRTDSIGPRTFRTLLNRFGGAGAALEALPEMSARAGKPVILADLDDIDREIAAAAKMGVRFVALGERDYPFSLQATDTAPPILSVRGNMNALNGTCVAIVGSRNASAAGLKFTQNLAHALGQAGYIVVSGLARGIDTAAHKASIATGTIAVLAGGQGKIYPSENVGLLDEIVENGAAISEMPLFWEPRARDFPRRNRLVSGLSLGVVVVEAARGSGSLITARFALEQGREVFAVPGSPLDPRAQGANDLIRNGATLCAEPAHVIDALAAQAEARIDPGPMQLFDPSRELLDEPLWEELDLDGFLDGAGSGDKSYQAHETPRFARTQTVDLKLNNADISIASDDDLRVKLLDLMGPQSVNLDDLIRLSGAESRRVSVLLLEMELSGHIRRHGGNGIVRTDMSGISTA
jgi:DNA processing protein